MEDLAAGPFKRARDIYDNYGISDEDDIPEKCLYRFEQLVYAGMAKHAE
jgi:hypothetical protein